MDLLIATANEHKVRELSQLLTVPGLRLLSLRDFPGIEMPEENASTMRGNARLKAEHCARLSGQIALADDSGIEVDFLDGAPGLHSARWAPGSDEDRMLALLHRLNEALPTQRGARYRCAVCAASPDGSVIEAAATCEGRIACEPRGSNGFGYDPIFEITAATGAPAQWLSRTMAEVPVEVKAQVSHRARAVMALKRQLLAVLAGNPQCQNGQTLANT